MQIIAEYPNTRQAGRAVGQFDSNIRKCCIGQQLTAGGYYWCYVEQYTPNWKIPIRVDRKKDIYQIDMHTLQIIKKWHGIVAAAEQLQINHMHIIACCTGKRYSAGNYCWAYADKYNEG